MGALDIRAQIHAQQHYYLTPLARTGKVPELLLEGLADATQNQWQQLRVNRLDENAQPKEMAMGYEFTRKQKAEQGDGSTLQWTERVLLVCSAVYAQQQQ